MVGMVMEGFPFFFLVLQPAVWGPPLHWQRPPPSHTTTAFSQKKTECARKKSKSAGAPTGKEYEPVDILPPRTG